MWLQLKHQEPGSNDTHTHTSAYGFHKIYMFPALSHSCALRFEEKNTADIAQLTAGWLLASDIVI